MLDHPNELTKEFISNLFNKEELDLDSFDFEAVGSGQVGDCYRINLNSVSYTHLTLPTRIFV